jgi:tetratricopeptide (TPR) repeat protein
MAEVVDLHRRLAAVRPGEFLPDLADSLDALASRQWRQGWRDQSLTAFREAIAVSRRLPDTFAPLLAGRLTDLSSRFAALGEVEQAVATSAEAVAIHRGLAAEQPATFLPELAGSLDFHARDLDDHGRREEAVATSTESVEIYRRLAAAQPDEYLRELASSLNTLSGRLVHAGQPAAALTAITEAVEHRRRLAENQPDFLPDLATGLGNLSSRLSDLDRLDEAIPPLVEAKDIYCRLVVVEPETFWPGLEQIMHHLANRLLELGRPAEAQAVFTDTYRFLGAALPDLFPSDSPDV